MSLANRPDYLQRIKAIGTRCVSLLKDAPDTNSHKFGLLQYAIGAIVAMRTFVEFDESLPEKPKWETTNAIAAKLMSGETIESQEFRNWRAGFYFNNSILRIVAVSERALRILNDISCSETHVTLGKLREGCCEHVTLKKRKRDWWNSLELTQQEVNRLKHRQGQTKRLIDEHTAILALENMVELCEEAMTASGVVGHF